MADPRPAITVAEQVLLNTQKFLREMPPFDIPPGQDPSLVTYRIEAVQSGITHALEQIRRERGQVPVRETQN
jgi:hypothetical protein